MDCVVDARAPGAVGTQGLQAPPTAVGAAASSLVAHSAARQPGLRPRLPTAPGPRWGTRASGLALALSVNAIALALFVFNEPMRHALRSALPLKVSVLTLPEAPPPKIAPPKVVPKLVVRDSRPLPPLSPPPELVVPVPEIQPTIQVQAITVRPAEPLPPPPVAPAVVTPPRFDADYLQNPPPTYPPLSKRLGEQGRVLLRVLVSSAGLAEKVELHASSGFDRLDQAALDVVARWRFVPARNGDSAAAGWVLIPITFALKP